MKNSSYSNYPSSRKSQNRSDYESENGYRSTSLRRSESLPEQQLRTPQRSPEVKSRAVYGRRSQHTDERKRSIPQRHMTGQSGQMRSDRRHQDYEHTPRQHAEVIRPAEQERYGVTHRRRRDPMHGSLLTFFYIFLFTLFAVGVLLLALPKQTVSEDENRTLQARPVFSLKNWFSSDYAQQWEKYFADHFPARQNLITVDQWAKRVTQIGGKNDDDVQFISGKREPGKGDQRFITTPAQNKSEETEPIAQPNGENNTPKPPAETEIAKNEPEKTFGRELGQQFHFEGQDGEVSYQDYSVMIANGRAMEVFYTADELEKDYAEALNHFASKLPANMRMFNVLVPTSSEFYGPEEFRTGSYSQYDAINRTYRMLDERIGTVDAYNELARHTKEYLYFRTDHHWNGAGAYYGYKAFCERAGLEPTPIKDMKKRVLDDAFLGTLYGMTNNNPQLKEFEDHAEFYFQKHQGELVYYSDAGMSDPIQGIFMNPDIDMGNQYLMYVGGDVPLAHITSTNKNGKSCVVFKESYGNAFSAYLVDNYEDIYLIDPRSFTDNVYPLLDKLKIDDVIVVNYTFAMGNPYWMKGFKAITQ